MEIARSAASPGGTRRPAVTLIGLANPADERPTQEVRQGPGRDPTEFSGRRSVEAPARNRVEEDPIQSFLTSIISVPPKSQLRRTIEACDKTRDQG